MRSFYAAADLARRKVSSNGGGNRGLVCFWGSFVFSLSSNGKFEKASICMVAVLSLAGITVVGFSYMISWCGWASCALMVVGVNRFLEDCLHAARSLPFSLLNHVKFDIVFDLCGGDVS